MISNKKKLLTALIIQGAFTASTANAFSAVRVCMGAKGTSEYEAAGMIGRALLDSRLFDDVGGGQTAGGVENLERIANNGCDIAVVRSDASLHYNTIYSSQSGSTQQIVALTDGSNTTNKKDSKDLLPSELYRQYMQLVCHRDAKLSNLDSVMDRYKEQAAKIRELEDKIASAREDERNATRKAREGKATAEQELIKAREKTAGLQGELDILNQNLVQIIFVRDGATVDLNKVDPNDQATVTWSQLLSVRQDLRSIPVRAVSPVAGLTAQRTALTFVRNNPNACFLNIDRLNTIISEVDKEKDLYSRLSLIEIEDGGFFTDGKLNNKKVNGVEVYSYVTIQDKALENLRAKRPEGRFSILSWKIGRGIEEVKTLSVRTQVIVRKNWLQDIGYPGYSQGDINPRVQEVIQKALQGIKTKMKDPFVK